MTDADIGNWTPAKPAYQQHIIARHAMVPFNDLVCQI